MDDLRTEDFFYELPSERIAQVPLEPRHNSRLLTYNRNTDQITDDFFYHIGQYLIPGDVLAINQTKVIPARIFAQKESGGKVEVLLLKQVENGVWECLVGGKRVNAGKKLHIHNGPDFEVVENLEGSKRLIQFNQSVEPFLSSIGEMPLPPYIHTRLNDPERYQTVFAKHIGSAAAPTAGLHFTEVLMKQLEQQGVQFVELTLHVGLDTFAPVTEENPKEHHIHTEWCEISPENATKINRAAKNGNRIIAVGTTSVRTLESGARFALPGEKVGSFAESTGLFILPGYQFKVVDAMITNFHLPQSTLLMLVSAFVGTEKILKLYRSAIDKEYRFFSFGDAMFLF